MNTLALYAYSAHPLLILLVIILLIGALPRWPYSQGWGYSPLGLILVVLLIVLLLGCTTDATGKKVFTPQGAAIMQNAETFATIAGTAAATYYGGPEAGQLASAGLSAIATVAQGYVGTTVPAGIIQQSAGVTGVGEAVADLIPHDKPISQATVNTVHRAAAIAATLKGADLVPIPAATPAP